MTNFETKKATLPQLSTQMISLTEMKIETWENFIEFNKKASPRKNFF